ncbi:MAG: tetratricopeptide repeat protein [candidate division Zixibacteria bacterium]
MKNKSHLYRLITIPGLVLISVWGTGCGSGKAKIIPVIEEQPREISEQDHAAGYNHFTNANLLEMLGAQQEALLEYERALVYLPESQTIRTDYARLLFRLHRLNEALTETLKIEPKDSEIYLLIGDCYRMTDRYKQGVSFYWKAVELDTDNINAHWYLAGYYRHNNILDSAIISYYELARLSDTYRIWHELGILLGQDKRYEEALPAFQKSVELNSDAGNINAYLGLATTYDVLDSITQAEEVLNRAVALDSNNVRIFRQMMAMHINHNDYEKALDDSKKLIALVPSDWVAVRRYGRLLYTMGHLDRADSLFQERIDFGDEHLINYFYLGLIAMERERFNNAEAYFHQAIFLDSSYVDSWLNLAFSYRQRDSLDKSISIYKQSIYQMPNAIDSNRIYFALGSAYEQTDQLHEAVDVFEKILETDPDHAPTLNYLGYMLADAGIRLEYALELIEKALTIFPNNGAYIDSYAWVHYRLGNFQLALSELEKAINLQVEDPVIYEHMGDIYKALKNRDEAERYYKKALELDANSIDIEEKMK